MVTKPNDKPAPKGPWDVPLREYVNSLPMTITVYDGDDVIKQEHVDYGNYEHRKFLGRITFWALSNDYTVETCKSEEGHG